MTEQELRALVRSIVDSRLSAGATPGTAAAPGQPAPSTARASVNLSYERFVLSPAPDGRCFIEPGVACNHCGFCQSYGH